MGLFGYVHLDKAVDLMSGLLDLSELPFALDGVYVLEALRCFSRLVGLELPDEVPRRGLWQGIDLGQSFLQAAFPEIADAQIVGGAYVVDSHRFRDGDQRYSRRISASQVASAIEAPLNRREVLGDLTASWLHGREST